MILKTRKTISVFLAAMLVFTLFAATVQAAPAPGYALKLTLETDKPNYAPGDSVTLSVFYDSAVANPHWGGGQIVFGFPQAAIDIHPDALAAYYGGATPAASGVITVPAHSPLSASGVLDPRWDGMDAHERPLDATESTYGWTIQRRITIATDDASAASFAPKAEAYQVNLKISDTCAPGTYYVGIIKEPLLNPTMECIAAIDSGDHGYQMYDSIGVAGDVGVEEGFIYDLSDAVVAINVGGGVSDPVVTNNGVQVKWGADNAHVQLGYKATISGLDITTTLNTGNGAYEVNELSEVGVLFSTTLTNPTLADVGSGATKVTSNTLYDNGDGTYSFRAIVKNAPIDNTTVINAVMYITLADGTTTYYSLSGAKSPKAAYDAGRLNGMPDFGA